MVHSRGNKVDNSILDQLRKIAARLDAMEIAQRRGEHLDDVSDDEEVATNHNPELKEDLDEERLLQVLSRENSKLVVEVVSYDGELDTNSMLDWISNMEKFFELEITSNSRKMKIIVTRLKG